MREIIFRGKRADNGEWVYGWPFADTADCSLKKAGKCQCPHDGSEYFIVEWDDDFHEYEERQVIPNTVGQYTGLKDKNGNGIWEGDIVDLFGMKGKVVQECGAFGIAFMKTIDYDLLESKIPFNNSANFCFNDNFISLWEVFWNYEQDDNPLYEVEVIGNIHDNPELLKEEAQP